MRKQDTNPISNPVEKRRAASVRTISLITTISAWIVLICAVAGYLYLLVKPTQIDLYYTVVVAAGTIMAICWTITNLLAQRNRINPAVWLAILSTEIVFIAMSFAIANVGIILAVILVLGLGNLILQSLADRSAMLAVATILVAGFATIAVDILAANPLRIIPPDWLIAAIVIAGGILTLVFGIQLLIQHNFRNLRSQIILAFVLISVIPLWTIAIFQLIAANVSLQTNAYEAIANTTNDVGTDFDNVLTRIKNNNLSDGDLPIFKKLLQDNNAENIKDALAYFDVIKERGEDVVAYRLIDKSGKVLADSTAAQPNASSINVTDFQAALQTQKSSISEVGFDQAIHKHVFYVSSPIFDGNAVMGVLQAEIDADFLQDEFTEEAQVQGKDVIVMLLDRDGVILADSSSAENRQKLIAPVSEERFAALQTKYALSSSMTGLNLNLSEVQKNLNTQNPSFKANLIPGNAEPDFVSYKKTENNPAWTVVVGRPVMWFTEPANTPARITILITTVLMITALAITMVASNLLTTPLHQLLHASQLLRAGKPISANATLERQDEIGQISRILNATTLELREITGTLENRINAQTSDLATKAEDSLQKANLLRSVVEITHAITPIQSTNELLPEITQQISQAFGFYHVGIFLTNQAGEYAVLQAASSAGGQKMLQKGYRVKVSQTEKIGFVTSSGQTLTVTETEGEASPFTNPNLPDTKSQIIVPLRTGENIIGALDLQSDRPVTFNTSSIDAFNLLADQISIAIQSAKSFEETRNDLMEAQVAYRQSATTSWRNVLHQGTRGYRYLNGNVEAIKEEKTSSQNHGAENKTQGANESLVIPINIRGKSLGTLNIQQAGRSHSWSGSEIRVYQSIVDRISFALENARLYQDAQRRAAKERVISEIATRVSSSVNMDNILQTAVEELGRVLPGSEIVIQFEHEQDETGSEFNGQE